MRRTAVGVGASIGVVALLAWAIGRAPAPADDARIERTLPDADAPTPRDAATPRLAGEPTPSKAAVAGAGDSVAPEPGAAAEVGPVRIAGLVVDRSTGLELSRLPLTLDVSDARQTVERTEAETDRDGTFETSVTVHGTATVTKVTFGRSGLRAGEWFPAGGRAGDAVGAKVGETLRVVIRADETFDVAGVVVDEAGAPLEGVTVRYLVPPTQGGEGWDGQWIQTGADGRFAVKDVLAHPEIAGNAVALAATAHLDLTKAGFAPVRLDTRPLRAAERAPVRVVLPRGRTIEGTLVDELGRPMPGVEVEALPAGGDDASRRTATTDAGGRFRLETLADGRVELGAFVPAEEAEARRTLIVSADLGDVELVARPIDLSDPRGPVLVAGLRLVDVDDELRRAHGLADRVRVVILDPGANASRLGAGLLRAGFGILRIGDRDVATARDVVDGLLALELGKGVRIVYTYAAGPGQKEAWTNTQTLRLSEADAAALRRRYLRAR